jgi:general nucleoside transport system ATP-binding protein
VAVLECRKIAKRYEAVVAVREASLVASPGEIHAVVGENGAGKSTLLKIACGLVRPDAGQVLIDGRELVPHTPREALARRVAMVQQHFALVNVMTALENIVLGAEPVGSFGRVDRALALRRVESVARELGVVLPLDARVETLGVGDRQRIEIARALYRYAQVLVLDEPTSVLAPQEADALYAALRRLAEGGRTIVVVTHKLDEVRAHADVVTAMRRGEVVRREARGGGSGLDIDALADAIMGADKPAPVTRHAHELGEVVLRVKNLVLGSSLDISDLEVRAGEVVGIAGVEGNGQRELVRILAGLVPEARGTVDLVGGPPAVVHEDRHVDGLVLDASVRDNLLLGELGGFERHAILDWGAMDGVARERMARGGVRPPDLDAPARALSGGNQQKIVTVRAVSRGRRLLVLAHPTRGVDLGAARGIHGQILEAASEGAGVLVVSSDLAELRTLCDRILVLRRGKWVGSFPPDATDLTIGAAMLGGDAPVAATA